MRPHLFIHRYSKFSTHVETYCVIFMILSMVLELIKVNNNTWLLEDDSYAKILQYFFDDKGKL